MKTRRIHLGNRRFATVDALMYDQIAAAGPWHLTNGYAVHTGDRVNGKQPTVYMHKTVLRFAGLRGRRGDHKNRKKLDNRLANLRPATLGENNCNAEKRSSNTSGFKGVSLHSATGKWRAKIYRHGRQHHLGLFSKKADAARAYNKAATKLHGQFALLNKIGRAA